MYAINWGQARLGWHLLFFWKNSTATTHRCSPTTGRQLQGSLAPVSAAGRKPCKARRHKAQHTACTPLRRWKQCHSLHNNLVVCTTNYQLSLLCGADQKTGNSKISLLAPGIRWPLAHGTHGTTRQTGCKTRKRLQGEFQPSLLHTFDLSVS